MSFSSSPGSPFLPALNGFDTTLFPSPTSSLDSQPPSPLFEYHSRSPTPSSPSSSKSSLFNRARSNSLHSSLAPSRRGSDAPHPPLPSFPTGLSSPSPSSATSSSFNFAAADNTPDLTSCPRIKSVSVPHYAKLGGRWVYACRVVPDCPPPTSARNSSQMVRTGSLGPMELAGAGGEGAREPHTIWRTWGEFVDFSTQLSAAFPVIPPPNSFPSVPSEEDDPLPPSFYREPPRLSKKITIFVTKNTVVQRQVDLDMFLRRLFDMPAVVRESDLVRDFFRVRDSDVVHTSSPSSSNSSSDISSPPSPDDEPESFARFLSEVTSPDATIRATTSKPKKRPGLSLKLSTPDMRKLMLNDSDPMPLQVPFPPMHGSNKSMNRPLIPQRAATSDELDVRNSKYSTFSNSSSTTLTPANVASSSRLPSPLALEPPPKRPVNLSAIDDDLTPIASPIIPGPILPPSESAPRRPRELLRHFHSLQDLRRPNHDDYVPPTPPLPSPLPPASEVMARAHTQPLPRTYPPPPPTRMARTSSTGSAAASGVLVAPHLHRQRSGSKSSTTSSFDDGTSLPPSPNLHTTFAGTFRHNPNGRLEGVPEVDGRNLPRTSSATKTHSPSASTSSANSSRSSAARSSFDMGRSLSSPHYGYASRRSSTDYSDASFAPATPPTPVHFETDWNGKYFVNEHGAVAHNNTVPPAPFFPVPPSMAGTPMQAAYSHDGMSHSPRHSQHSHRRRSSGEARRSSGGSRSRAASSASGRPPLDTILGSPHSSSHSSTSSMPQSVRPQDRPTVTIKVLYPDSNLVLRVVRNITLAQLRAQIDLKLAISAGVRLEQWALSYSTQARVSGDNAVGYSEIILSEEDFRLALDRTAHLEKVILRIVH